MMRMMLDPISGTMYGFEDSIITAMISSACYSKSDIDTRLASVLKLCGQINTLDELPSNPEVGDVWIVLSEHAEYAYLKTHVWEELGPIVDFNAYVLKTALGELPEQYTTVVGYINAVSNIANAAVPQSTYNSFLSTNSSAIADAKKAGTDAADELRTYKTSNDQALANVRTTANAALPSASFQAFQTTNTKAISDAKTAADNAQSAIDQFKSAQLVFEASATSIKELTQSSEKIITEDDVFSRRKTYYKLVDDEYIPLTLGTDYQALDIVANYGEDVYEDAGVSMTVLVNKINELITSGNMLIAAHQQLETLTEQESE